MECESIDSYKKVLEFKKKYKGTLAFRLKAHCKVLDKHLNPGEKIVYVFAGQKNSSSIAVPNTFVVALTNKRLLFARKRLFFGYFFYAVTPDMFNDLTVKMGLVWGKVYIDTVKEFVCLSNIQKEALPEIETASTGYMMEEKKKYGLGEEEAS